jgi:hypothetical protein
MYGRGELWERDIVISEKHASWIAVIERIAVETSYAFGSQQ